MSDQRQLLSDSLAQPLISAYRAGGLGLTFLVLGSLLLAWSGGWLTDSAKYAVMALGLVLIGLPCWYFYLKDIRPIARAQRAVRQNRETIDAVQSIGLALTELTWELQTLLFKHADEVRRAVAVIRPTIGSIPVVGPKVDPVLAKTESFSSGVVDLADGVRSVVADVKATLLDPDPAELKKYVAKLNVLESRLHELLATD